MGAGGGAAFATPPKAKADSAHAPPTTTLAVRRTAHLTVAIS